jgi:hypothetical protein
LKKSASYADLLFEREDVAGKKSVSFLILTSILYFSFILLYLLYLYSGAGERTSMAGLDLMDL